MKNVVKNIQAAAYNGTCMVNDLYPISSTIWWTIDAHPNLVQDKTNTQNSDFCLDFRWNRIEWKCHFFSFWGKNLAKCWWAIFCLKDPSTRYRMSHQYWANLLEIWVHKQVRDIDKPVRDGDQYLFMYSKIRVRETKKTLYFWVFTIKNSKP